MKHLSATTGRYVVSARQQHLVSDSLHGPREAVSATELLLAALASCALGNVERHGPDLDLDTTGARVTVSAERDPDDRARFRDVAIVVSMPMAPFAGVREVADRFTATCPIYNSLRHGAPVRVVVESAPERTA